MFPLSHGLLYQPVEDLPQLTLKTEPFYTGNNSGIFFKPDGQTMYLTDYSTDYMTEFSLSEPWNINTKTFIRQGALGSGSWRGFCMSPDGTKAYIGENGGDDYHQFTLSTPWDASSISLASGSVTFPANSNNPVAIAFVPDGTRVMAVKGTEVKVVDLSVPYDLSSTQTVITNTTISRFILGFDFFNNGLSLALYVSGNGGELLVYDLPQPGDFNNRSNERLWMGNIGGSGHYCLYVKNDASAFYTINWGSDLIKEFSTRES